MIGIHSAACLLIYATVAQGSSSGLAGCGGCIPASTSAGSRAEYCTARSRLGSQLHGGLWPSMITSLSFPLLCTIAQAADCAL